MRRHATRLPTSLTPLVLVLLAFKQPDYWFVTDNPAPTRVYLVLSGVKKDKKRCGQRRPPRWRIDLDAALLHDSTELEVNGYCGAFVNKAEAEERSALRRKNLDVLDGAEVKELQKAMSFFVQEATVI